MAIELNELKIKNQSLNDDLNVASKKLQNNKSFDLNSKSYNQTKELFSNSSQSQKNQIKQFEDDNKKFKLLKKYGEILEKIQKLLDIIPSSLENLSIEELNEKLDQALKTRKKNQEQIDFIFYQNLLSDLLQNLVNIEKDYQSGIISSREALDKIKTAKYQVKDYVNDMPVVLHDSLKQSSDLIKIYEESFSQVVEKTTQSEETPLIQTTIKIEHELLFEKINAQTKDIIQNVNSLSNDLSNFEPQVDLTSLISNMGNTESIFSNENWDFNELDSSVSNLERTANSLIDEQVSKNLKNESLTSRINELTNNISNMNKKSIYEISEQTFKEVNSRAETSKEIVEEVSEMSTDDNKFATDIQKQIAETIITNLENDEDFSNLVATDPNAAVEFKSEVVENQAKDVAVELLSKTEQYELEVGMVKSLQKEIEDDEDDENKQKNSNN